MPTVLSVFGVEPSRIGGTETLARELSKQLDQHGWQSVLCFESEPVGEVKAFLDLPNVTIEVLRCSSDPTLTTIRRLAALIRQHKPDILHTYFTGFVSVMPWLAQLLSVKKVFFTDQSSRPSNYIPKKAPFWKRVSVRLINYPITRVICASQYGFNCLTTLDLLPASRYQLIYNAVDLSRVLPNRDRAEAFRQRLGIPAGKKTVVQISWVIPEKGIADLLEMAYLLHKDNVPVQLVIVGDGPYRDYYTEQAKAMGISDNVTWTGLVKDPFGEGVFDAADIVCQLSSWEELFGWMIAEAMAYRKPVVATSVGGIPELVDHAETGFLVARGDNRSAAQHVKALIGDSGLRERLGTAGHDKVQRKFNLEANVSELVRLYSIVPSDAS
jgi:glycosyltransferase involved in cell wall biosynthesis